MYITPLRTFNVQSFKDSKINNKQKCFTGYDKATQTAEEILGSVAKRLLQAVMEPKSIRLQSRRVYLPVLQGFEHLGEFRLHTDKGPRDFVLLKLDNGDYQIQKKHLVDRADNPIQVNILRLNGREAVFHSVRRKGVGQKWSQPFFDLTTKEGQIITDFHSLIDELIKM